MFVSDAFFDMQEEKEDRRQSTLTKCELFQSVIHSNCVLFSLFFSGPSLLCLVCGGPS